MQPRSRRRVLASIFVTASALALAAFYREAAYNVAGYAIPPLLLGSVALLWVRSLGAQLLVRGVWWGTSLIGSALAVGWASTLSGHAAAVAALGSSIGLLALGFDAAVPDGKSPFFAPRAGRATFSIALLLALTDALALGYFGVLYGESHLAGTPLVAGESVGLLFGLAALSAVCAAGVFTLRVWAWAGSVLCTIAIGAAAYAGLVPVPSALAGGLSVVGLLAVVTQLPLVVQLLRGRGLRPSPRAWALVPVAVLMTLGGLSLATLMGCSVG